MYFSSLVNSPIQMDQDGNMQVDNTAVASMQFMQRRSTGHASVVGNDFLIWDHIALRFIRHSSKAGRAMMRAFNY